MITMMKIVKPNLITLVTGTVAEKPTLLPYRYGN